MDAEEQRYNELKARWQALQKGDDGDEDQAPDSDYDEDLAFAELVDDMGSLDAMEEYLQDCEEAEACGLVILEPEEGEPRVH
jgi:hypothetical protein